ncbi:hypothetical protein KFE25_012729 [Diacronema lutheri]|mgnify:CR=1 FL=1|uniref:Hemerythrin-like domain-containing protein n=2 Tax=Diacronema lutheri TaxID=2081491 RepID=A0A8J5X565_DIALT|nr:hypothetical protein KFE25_012729 [Diacronema lutheri]
MERWAVAYGDAARFVCVSCAGPELAGDFGRKLKLRTCVNTWVEEDDMPTWGQLGCNGLIVLDSKGTVVCKSSPAFLEVRQRAFEYVETLLDALLSASAPPASGPRAGASVRVSGLVSRADLNGLEGVCVAPADAGGRCAVSVGGETLSIKLGNLEALEPTGGGGGSADGACASSACALPKRGAAAGDGAATGEGASGAAKKGKTGSDAERAVESARRVSVPSVLVPELDAEHEACAAALERLAAERTPAAATALLDEYERHFAHEEALLDAHVYGHARDAPASAGFSAAAGARRSHLADHALLLDGVRALLGAGAIGADAAARVAAEFERHAEQYDGGYVDALSRALARAAA